MYQSEIWRLKEDIKNVPGIFEACKVANPTFNGIQIVGVRKVPNSRGLHCAFIDLEDYRGNDFTVLLNGSNRFNFTKPVSEVGCHVDLWSTDNKIQIFSNKGEYSQLIEGLSFAHTVYGHSSYYVYAVRTNISVVPPVVESEALKLIREIEERTKRLKELVK